MENEVKIIDNQYRVLKKLGEGGQGKVLLVEENTTNKKFALKLLKNIDKIKDFRRFKKEISSLKSIDSENVIKIVINKLNNNIEDTNFIYDVIDDDKLKGIRECDFGIKNLLVYQGIEFRKTGGRCPKGKYICKSEKLAYCKY